MADFDEVRCELCDELMVNCRCPRGEEVKGTHDPDFKVPEHDYSHLTPLLAKGDPSLDAGTEMDDPETKDRRKYRIEALRAASRIVAGSAASGCVQNDKDTGEQLGFGEATLRIAEQFAKWLETGDK